jgi:hypothetical protein
LWFNISYLVFNFYSYYIGIFDDNWRIRQASVQLLGEFISRVMPVEDEDSVEIKRDSSIIEGDQGIYNIWYT